MSRKRDQLRGEILPVGRIVAAAGLVMGQRTGLPSDVDLARFIASLNVRELRELGPSPRPNRLPAAPRPIVSGGALAISAPRCGTSRQLFGPRKQDEKADAC
jgi:hypothetical protein